MFCGQDGECLERGQRDAVTLPFLTDALDLVLSFLQVLDATD